MNCSAYWKSTLLVFACAVVGVASLKAAEPADSATVAETIKKNVAEIVAGLNAHDVMKATAYDAPDIVSMECGGAPVTGADADREGFKSMFAHDTAWRVSLIDENVDVASSGDLAVYRGTYYEHSSHADVPMVHKTILLAEFKRSGGRWWMAWYSVSNTEASHPEAPSQAVTPANGTSPK
jgi:ketosteroid isomerase-like protein